MHFLNLVFLALLDMIKLYCTRCQVGNCMLRYMCYSLHFEVVLVTIFFFFFAVINHHDQQQLMKDGVYFVFYFERVPEE